MSTAAGLALAWWCGGIAALAATTALAILHPTLARRRHGKGGAPPVSVLVPLAAPSVAVDEAMQALLAETYREFEVVVAARAGDEAALAQARAIATGTRPFVSVESPAEAWGNPKAANLAEAVRVARHEHLLFKDGAIILEPGQIAAMMNCLGPGIGLVGAVPLARGPEGVAATVETALMNGLGARFVLAGAALGCDIGLGASLLMRRGDLERCDGLAAMAASVADDHALAKAMRRAGLATVIAPRPVWQRLGRRPARAVWARHLRWAVCRRDEAPLAFAAEPAVGLVAVAAAGAVAAGPVALLATLLAWPAAEMGLAAARGWPMPPAMPLAVWVREALHPALWVAALLSRRLSWAGRPVDLGLAQGRPR
jgi:ceramide glucosyltransferase